MDTSSNRLLNDREILLAIEKGLIDLEDPDMYLGERKYDLIQPASMDLILRDIDGAHPILPGGDDVPLKVHDDVCENYVTFWPQSESEVIIENLKWFNGNLLNVFVEVRSTLKKMGLDAGFMPYGIGFGMEGGFIHLRNPQDYPVSIEKGTKIAQALWINKRLLSSSERDRYFIENPDLIGSGICISNNNDLEILVEQGDLWLGEKPVFEKGVVLFHAGEIETRNFQEHMVLHRDGKPNFSNLTTKKIKYHNLKPGRFSDIRTREKMRLSGRVGIFVRYHADYYGRRRNLTGEDLFLTHYGSSGGWVDPGYGKSSKDGAVFSVQRKAFTNSWTIRSGSVVGYGRVFFFPKGVETPYGHPRRNSLYQGAKEFEAPKV